MMLADLVQDRSQTSSQHAVSVTPQRAIINIASAGSVSTNESSSRYKIHVVHPLMMLASFVLQE
jgi:hypothetical protein